MSSGFKTWPQEGPPVAPSAVWVMQLPAPQAAPVVSSGIPDAPADGQIYGRQSPNWTPLTPANLGLVGPTEQLNLPPPFVPPDATLYWRLILGGNMVQVGGSLNFGSPFSNGTMIVQLPLPVLPSRPSFNYGICAAATGSGAVSYAVVILDMTGSLIAFNPTGLVTVLYLNNLYDLTL